MATKERLNICFIGHVDSGKSTTVGILAYKLGCIDKRKMDKHEKDSADLNKASFKYAFVADKHKAERERGITMDSKTFGMETEKFLLNVIDCPGHKDFIKNMVKGSAQADVAVCIIPAGQGEFEGALAGGIMREHIMICGILGVPKMVYLVNKIDTVLPEFQEQRFGEIVKELKTIAKGCHPDKNPIFLPISAFNNVNIVKDSDRLNWFCGWEGMDCTQSKAVINSLEEALNFQSVPPRPLDKPLRGSINDSLKISGIGTVLTGQVISGILKQGQQVIIQPADVRGEIKSLEIHKQSVPEVPSGENCGFVLKVTGGDPAHIKTGHVFSDPKNNPVTPCSGARAKIIVVDHPKGIKKGYTPVMDVGTAHVPCKLAKFLSKRPKGTKEEVMEPEIAMKGDTLTAVLMPQKPVVMESAKVTPQLGRCSLRDGGRVFGLGAVDYIYTETELVDMGCRNDPKAPTVAGDLKDKKKKKK